MRVDTAELAATLESVLGESSDPHVQRAARWVIQAEMLGLPAFGLDLITRDLERVQRSEGAPHNTTTADHRATHSLNASSEPGVVALARATHTAVAAATKHGVGIVGLQDVGGLGVIGFAARDIAEQGYIALIMAHAPAWVAPWGGTAAAIGTNPIAVATPRNPEPPLVFDFATASATLATLRHHRETGDPLPNDTALNAMGTPTTDANEAAALIATSRTASLVGLLVEIFAGVATGAREPAEASKHTPGRGAIVLAIDPAGIGGAQAAAACRQLAADWQHAGGHVPARFDDLPGRTDPLPETVEVHELSYQKLHTRGGGAHE